MEISETNLYQLVKDKNFFCRMKKLPIVISSYCSSGQKGWSFY